MSNIKANYRVMKAEILKSLDNMEITVKNILILSSGTGGNPGNNNSAVRGKDKYFQKGK